MSSRDWPTRSEMVVLRTLLDSPEGMYGLQVVAASHGAITRTSVYVLLSRLTNKGFVKVKKPKRDPQYPGLPRPLYVLTADGMRLLSAAEAIAMGVGA